MLLVSTGLNIAISAVTGFSNQCTVINYKCWDCNNSKVMYLEFFINIFLFQNLLEYTLTSSTRANVKGNFVKLHDEQLTHGMRFTKPSIAQEVWTIKFPTDFPLC